MPGYIFIGCLVLLIVLLCIKNKGIKVPNVYTDDDLKKESEKK